MLLDTDMFIFDFFKKKETKKPINIKEEETEDEYVPVVFTKTPEELNQLYSLSVQKTPKDFVIKEFDLNGQPVTVAMDAAVNSDGLYEIMQKTFQMQLLGQEQIFTYFAKKGFIGFNNCSVLAQDWLIMKAITAPCEDAISVNYDLTCNEKEITEQEQDVMLEIKNISNDITKFDIKKVCETFAKNKRMFGQSLSIPLIDGVDYSKPFNIDAVGYKTYKGMITVEPVWVTNVLSIDGTTNPLSKRFYKPEWFRLPNGTLIHYTWVIFGQYGNITDILKPTYYWGGVPLPQLLYEQVYAAHKTAKEAPMLAMTKRTFYVDGQPEKLAFNKKAQDEISCLSWVKDNFGWVVKREGQQIGQLDTSLSDFDSVVMLSYQIVAAISGVIATRLLETSPKGWQSSGSYEDKQYKKLLQNIQNDDFAPILNLHYKLLAKSHYNLDKEYQVCFEEIDTPTAKEAAEIREINARTDTTYINAGVLSAEEVRTTLREDVNSGYTSLEEEMPEGEENPFEDIGGSSNEQSPFSEDEEVFNLDEWKETDHPRNKNGEFTKGENNNIQVGQNENFAKDVQKVLINARFNLDNSAKAEIGEVSQKLVNEAKENGFDITNYKHNVDVSGVQHAFKHHGIGNEKEKSQKPITPDDIIKIPEVLYHYDKVTFGTKDKKGTDIIKYQKQMQDGEIFYLEEIRTGKKTLTIKTMYKKSR